MKKDVTKAHVIPVRYGFQLENNKLCDDISWNIHSGCASVAKVGKLRVFSGKIRKSGHCWQYELGETRKTAHAWKTVKIVRLY